LLHAPQGLGDGVVFLAASHEACEAPRGRGMEALPGLRHAQELEDLDRLRDPTYGDRAERAGLEEALHEANRRGGAERGARLRELLQTRGEVRGLTDGGVVHVEVRADGADQHVPRVQTDANLNRDAVAPLHLVAVPREIVEHPEGGVSGAKRMVLERERRAEERHDPVAEHLVHGALVGVNRFHHDLEHRIQELSRLLGIAIHQELHRALDVGEDDGDLLALALHRAPEGEDAIGQVTRRVAAARAEAGRDIREGGKGAKRRATHVAEAIVGRAFRPARGADAPQNRAAVAAELRGGAVVGSAPWADHGALACRPAWRGPGRPAKIRPSYFPGAL
jgi:hypothetical protein